MTTELHRPIPLSSVGPGGLAVQVIATPEECMAVAARMGIPAIQSLKCYFDLRGKAGGLAIYGRGHLSAWVTRVCVVSAEDFETLVEDEFTIRFVPAGSETDDLPPDEPDEIPCDGDTIDLGAAATEQLALVLDPYPRREGATMPDLKGLEDALPFVALSRRAGSSKRTG